MRNLFIALLIVGLSVTWGFAQTNMNPSNTTQTQMTVETHKKAKVESKKKVVKKAFTEKKKTKVEKKKEEMKEEQK
jgi:hypothetical protein